MRPFKTSFYRRGGIVVETQLPELNYLWTGNVEILEF